MDSFLSAPSFDSASVARSLESLRSVTNIIDIKDIELPPGQALGNGGYGLVFRAVYHKGPNEKIDCAVKQILEKREIESFRNEVHQLSRVNHENIVKIYGAVIEDPCCLVLEYASGGSLYNVLHCPPYCYQIQYTLAHALSWCLQCIRGVEYLHTMKPQPLMHRDLKPPNLLLVDGMLTLKICDFGTACQQRTYMSNAKGSAPWMAPEVVNGRHYTQKCDIFSWAIILWEVLSRRKPYDHLQNAFSIMYAINNNFRPPLFDNAPRAFTDLIQQCWHMSPGERPTATELVKKMGTLLSYCDRDDLTQLSYPIPLRSGYSSSTVSLDSSIARTPIATQMPNLYLSDGMPNFQEFNNSLPSVGSNEPSTSQQRTLEPQRSASASLPRHRRQLSGDLSAIEINGGTAIRKTSLPTPKIQDDTPCQVFTWMEARLQPLPPLSDCKESVAIYDEHKASCKEYYKETLELDLLKIRDRELDRLLAQPCLDRKNIRLIFDDLFKEHQELSQLEEGFKQDVNRSIHNSQDDDWVHLP